MVLFDIYAALLIEWQEKINLVARSTLDMIWDRHFADSVQLVGLVDKPISMRTQWLDIGSGAGFPALAVALLAPGHFHLVEATAKKCRFLSYATIRLGLEARVTIHNARIEHLPVLAADMITARACASLTQLFDWGERHGGNAQWLLPKGRNVNQEVAVARTRFDFVERLVPSRTDAEARIVNVVGVRRRRQ